jgi:RNA polymerase sigma-70 factor
VAQRVRWVGTSLSRGAGAVKSVLEIVKMRASVPATSKSTNPWRPGERLAARAFAAADAQRWSLSRDAFGDALERSVRRAFADAAPDAGQLERYIDSLHLKDLSLACACADGDEAAWEHFVREYRPALYRAADAIDASGGAREAADSIYGELFGLSVRDGQRQSHFRYFHGRSSLATWLRAVLSQRYVDQVRQRARTDPLPADEVLEAAADPTPADDPALARYVEIMRRVLTAAIAALTPRDRLRLRCYYAQDLTLAQIGKTLGEHEATTSRQLARTRRGIREEVERRLRNDERMLEPEIGECFRAVAGDPGSLDLARLFEPDTGP